jgi:hypothetical protein
MEQSEKGHTLSNPFVIKLHIRVQNDNRMLGEDTLTFGANHNASEFKLLTYIHKKPSK